MIVNPYTAKVEAMTLDDRRKRLGDIQAMAKRGDFSYDYSEAIALEEAIPEEKHSMQNAAKK